MSFKYWEKAFDFLPDCICILTKTRKILKCNRSISDVTLSPGTILGYSCHEIFFNHKQPCNNCPLGLVLSDLKSHSVEIEHNNRFFLVTAGPILDDNFELLGIIHQVKDITDRRLLEDKYKTIIENINDGLVIANKHLSIEYVNSALEKMFGYSSYEFKTNHISNFLTKESYSILQTYRDLIRSNTLVSKRFTLTGLSKYGERLRLVLSVTIINGKSITIVTNTTELFNVSSEMRQLKNSIRIGEILINGGFITFEQLQYALSQKNKKLGEILIERGFLTDDQLVIALEQQKLLNSTIDDSDYLL